MDRLDSFKVFAAVAETGSFTAAASKLEMSRPMVSKHIAALEQMLGLSLLSRTTRSVRLTEEGHTFLQRCELILDQFNEAMREAGDSQTAPSGSLRISTSYSFGRLHGAKAIAEFQKKWPDIHVNLIMNDRQVDLVEEGYDLAIRIGRLKDSSLIARKLADCKMIVCASPEYLARAGIPMRPKDLSNHECLHYEYYSHGRSWMFTRDGQSETVLISGRFSSNYGEAINEAGVAGLGVLIGPEFLVSEHLANGELVPILTDWDPVIAKLYAVYPASRITPLKVRALINHLVEYFSQGLPTS